MADYRSIICQRGNANTPSIQSSSTAIAANTSRSAWMIQNTGTSTLYVLLGSGATTLIFHVALKAGSQADDGSGGTVSQESGIVYTGIITVAGSNPRYVVTEI